MSAHAIRLAKILLNELFGELVAEVGSVLLKCGGQPLRDLVIETKLRKSEVQKSLLVLIQHNLVTHQVQNSNEIYSFQLKRLLRWTSFPKYIALAKLRYGDVGELILEDLLRRGQSLLSDLVQRLSGRIEETSQESHEDVVEAVKHTFQQLVTNYCIMRTETHSVTAGEGEGQLVTTETDTDSAAKRFQPLPQDIMQSICVRKRRRSEDNDEPTPKKKKETENAGSVEPVDVGVFWTVNIDKFEQLMSQNKIVAAVSKRIDTVSGTIMQTVFDHFNPTLCETSRDSMLFRTVDVVRNLPSTVSLSQEQVEQYFKVLSDDKFIKKIDDGGGSFVVDYDHISRVLCQCAVESIVRERFGTKSHRIFRLILMKRYLDQKQISDLAMVPQKEAKEMLYTLLAEHFVTVQEIPRSQDYAPARTFYLFTVNLSQVATMLLERCYKTAGNVKVRWLSERDEHRRLLEKKATYDKHKAQMEQEGMEDDVRELEETLTPDEREQIRKIDKVLLNLEQAELKVHKTITTLLAFLGS